MCVDIPELSTAAVRSRGRRGALRGLAISTSLVAALAATATGAEARTLYVAPSGSDSGQCTRPAPCKTISHTIRKAHAGDAVRVGRGTYAEEVMITKDISLVGARGAVLDAAGLSNGVIVKGKHAAGASVRGMVVENATFEGILAVGTSGLKIESNTVRSNDLGAAAKKPVGECAPQGQVPGDCGEGVHLMSVSHAKIANNRATANEGGILVTDEVGPSAHNLITGNRVTNNLYDCGITIAGHSTKAVSMTTGLPQPALAGIYDNTISDNVSMGNGTKGEGAGVLLAAAAPGAGVYNNVVSGNTTAGNSLGGIVLHSHAPFQDINGNKLIGNHLNGDGGLGDPEFGQTGTVGIVVASAVTKLSGIVITGNTISNVATGIFAKNLPTLSPGANTYTKVTTPITQT